MPSPTPSNHSWAVLAYVTSFLGELKRKSRMRKATPVRPVNNLMVGMKAQKQKRLDRNVPMDTLSIMSGSQGKFRRQSYWKSAITKHVSKVKPSVAVVPLTPVEHRDLFRTAMTRQLAFGPYETEAQNSFWKRWQMHLLKLAFVASIFLVAFLVYLFFLKHMEIDQQMGQKLSTKPNELIESANKTKA